MFAVIKGVQLELLRDKGALFFVLIFPTLLVAILGAMLSSMDNPEARIAPMRIAVVVEEGADGRTETLAEQTFASFAEVEQVELLPSASLSASREALAAGELDAVVVFTASATIELYQGEDSIQARAARTVFEGVSRMQAVATVLTDELAAQMAALALEQQAPQQAPHPAATEEEGGGAASAMSPPVSTPDALPTLSSETLPSRIEEEIFGISRSMTDYYAITMIVMMFFMSSATSAASTLYSARKSGTLARTLASSQSRLSLYLQFVVSNLPLNIVQVAVVMLCSTLFLGAQYATTLAANLLLFAMLVVAGMAASAVFMLVGLLLKTNPFLLLMPFMWVLLFLSGSFSKVIDIPGVSGWLPPRLIQDAAFDLTLFGQVEKSVAVLLVSVLLIGVASIAGVILFNRKTVAQ